MEVFQEAAKASAGENLGLGRWNHIKAVSSLYALLGPWLKPTASDPSKEALARLSHGFRLDDRIWNLHSAALMRMFVRSVPLADLQTQ